MKPEYDVIINGQAISLENESENDYTILLGDDTVYVMIQKIKRSQGIYGPVYVYARQRFKMTDSIALSLTESIFGPRKYISRNEAAYCIYNNFELNIDFGDGLIISRDLFKKTIRVGLKKQQTKVIPLVFSFMNHRFPNTMSKFKYKYRNDASFIDQRQVPLHKFDLMPDKQNRVNIFLFTPQKASHSNKKKMSKNPFYPLKIHRFKSEQESDLQLDINNILYDLSLQGTASHNPNYVSLASNQNLSEHKRISLDAAFEAIHASNICPMMKYMSKSQTLYKVYKKYILESSKPEDMLNLLNTDVYYIHDRKDVLVLFVISGIDSPLAEIRIFESLRFQVKLKFRQQITKEKHDINSALLHVNKALDNIKTFLKFDIIPKVDVKDMIDSKISGFFTYEHDFDWKSVLLNITELHDFFFLVSTTDACCTLYYKRSENYASSKNIIAYLMNIPKKVSDEKKLEDIQLAFGISRVDAETHFDEYKSQLLILTDKPGYDEIKHDAMKRKVDVIVIEICHSVSKKFGFEILHSTNEFDILQIIDLLNDIATRTRRFKEPPINTSSRNQNKPINYNTRTVKFLKVLQESDPGLFTKGYPKSCPANENRQPNVIKTSELEGNYRAYKDNFLKINDKIYVCPDVWCAGTNSGMTHADFIKNPSSCQGANVLIDSKYFKNRPRFIGLVSGKQYPCCNIKSVDNSKDPKYILAENKTTPAGRYRLLPKDLSYLLGNVHCGKRDSMNGKMTSMTDCYMAYGIDVSQQPFLLCMAKFLGFSSVTSLVEVVVENITMPIFLQLNDGRVLRDFESADNTDTDTYDIFYKWFLDPLQNEYINQYDLVDIRAIISDAKSGERRDVTRRVKREFEMWKAFYAFLEYIVDDEIPKSHEHFIDLFSMKLSWLNDTGMNIIVFSDVSVNYKQSPDGLFIETESQQRIAVSCSLKNLRTHSKSLLIIHNPLTNLYEPIYNVKLSKDTWRHDPTTHVIENVIAKLHAKREFFADYVIQSVTYVNHKVSKQLINRDMKLIGFFTNQEYYIPFEQPEPIYKKIKVNFIDEFLVTQKIFNPKSLNLIQALHLKYLNLAKYEKVTGGIAFKNTFVPLLHLPINDINDDLHLEIINDASLFDGFITADARYEMAKVLKANSHKYLSFRNNVFSIVLANSDLEDMVIFVRNSSNPMPLSHKRAFIRKKFKKRIDQSDGELFEKCLDDLLNPIIPLQHVNVNLKHATGNYTFTADDLIASSISDLLHSKNRNSSDRFDELL